MTGVLSAVIVLDLKESKKREKKPMPEPSTRGQAPSFSATVSPPGLESEVTFISGVTADRKVAATSFGAWTAFQPYPSIPAQYDPYYSYTTKWGDPTLQLAGTPAVV